MRRVPLNRELVGILREWRDRCPKGELVFPKPDGTMRAAERPPVDCQDHLAGAGCHAVTFHDQGWAFELKWDGMRALVATGPGGITICNRRDTTSRAPSRSSMDSGTRPAI